jgi:hypothetical protein
MVLFHPVSRIKVAIFLRRPMPRSGITSINHRGEPISLCPERVEHDEKFLLSRIKIAVTT